MKMDQQIIEKIKQPNGDQKRKVINYIDQLLSSQYERKGDNADKSKPETPVCPY